MQTMYAKTREETAELLKELERQAKSKRDIISASKDIRVEEIQGKAKLTVDLGGSAKAAALDKGTLEMHGGRLVLDVGNHAANQLAERTGIGRHYWDKLETAPGLMARNVNHWMEQDKRNVLVRTLDGKARALLSDSYRVLDNVDLFYEAYKVAKDVGAEIQHAALTDDGGTFQMRFIHPEWRERIEVQKASATSGHGRPARYDEFIGKGLAADGDEIVIPGISLRNSEIGRGGLHAEQFMFALSCDNGMVTDVSMRQVHLGSRNDVGWLSAETKNLEDQTFWAKVHDLITTTFDREAFRQTIAALNDTAGQELAKPIEAVDAVVQHFGFSEDDRQAILNELVSPNRAVDPGRTVYGLIQAVTTQAKRYAGNADPEVPEAFEIAGGKLLTNARDLVEVR